MIIWIQPINQKLHLPKLASSIPDQKFYLKRHLINKMILKSKFNNFKT